MFTKKSISCGVSILFIGMLTLMSFVTVHAVNETTARDIILVIDTTAVMSYETSGDPNRAN